MERVVEASELRRARRRERVRDLERSDPIVRYVTGIGWRLVDAVQRREEIFGRYGTYRWFSGLDPVRTPAVVVSVALILLFLWVLYLFPLLLLARLWIRVAVHGFDDGEERAGEPGRGATVFRCVGVSALWLGLGVLERRLDERLIVDPELAAVARPIELAVYTAVFIGLAWYVRKGRRGEHTA